MNPAADSRAAPAAFGFWQGVGIVAIAAGVIGEKVSRGRLVGAAIVAAGTALVALG